MNLCAVAARQHALRNTNGLTRRLLPVSKRIFHPRIQRPNLSSEQERERLILQESMITDAAPKPRIAVPILFSVLVTGLGFGLAAIQTNEETERWREVVLRNGSSTYFTPSFSMAMFNEWRQSTAKAWQTSFNEFQKKIVILPSALRGFAQYSYYYVAQNWVNMTEGKQMCYKLVGCFAAVYVAGLIPAARRIVFQAFSHDPLSGRSFTLFTSQFGHGGLLHLAVNSFALIGFGEFAWSYMRFKQISEPGRMDEAVSGDHFLAFHLAVSHLITARFIIPRMVSRLSKGAGDMTSAASAARILPSTGASGAIWASLAITALGWPHTTVTLIFLPFIPISIGSAFVGLVAVDVVGLIRGWRFFDHAAHLGGAAFGTAYFYYGPIAWDWWRRTMQNTFPVKTDETRRPA
ncbi:hypothetical protein CPB86DRAFT_771357 [Serendipita vermifera]|nr:hypothetical protein CPB86DRAFT_771357 [Serendipita vermifera]